MSLFRDGVLLVVSDFALRVLRGGAASSVCTLEPRSPTAAVSKVAEAALAFCLVESAVSVGLVAVPALGNIVRPCCSVPEATAEVRVGSGLSNASQR